MQAQWFACEADAEAAIAAYEGRGQGRRGRRPRPWRYHTLRYGLWQIPAVRAAPVGDVLPRPTRRQGGGLSPAGGGDALANVEEDNGWAVLATTVRAETCTDAEILQAYQEQTTTVEPGFRWIKNPAAIAPVWLEKPERIAALAMLTVLGLLVYSVIQRQVRLYLRTHDQQLPGNKGLTAIPTAAVVLALFTQVALVQLWIDEQEVAALWSPAPPPAGLSCAGSRLLVVCRALSPKKRRGRSDPLNLG